jgi:sugar phosphate isomerase/epimerase
LRVAFQVTIIQTETRFNQVICSCLRAHFNDHKEQFANAAKTLKEVHAKPEEKAARTPIVVGLQIYSLREQAAKDLPATLAEIEKWGISDVELGALYNLTPEQFRKELDAHHLHATGIHFQWHQLLTDIDGDIRAAKILGCDYVSLPWIPHKGAFTADDAKTACEKFNEWGKKCADAGLHFTYHPHGYEFGPYKDGTVFDMMAASTRPEWVNFELDVFWAHFAGADPVKLLQKYPTRFPLLHLKDMEKSVKVPNDGPKPMQEANVPLGTGQIDIAGILRESVKIGVKHYYIEDESSRSEDQIPKSARFISEFDPR